MKIDSSGMALPDEPPTILDLIRMCPGCGARTWPDVSPAGAIHARHCIPCQIKIDRANGIDL